MLHDCKLVLLDPLQSPIRVYYDLGSRGKALFGFLRVNLQIRHQGIESPFHSGCHNVPFYVKTAARQPVVSNLRLCVSHRNIEPSGRAVARHC